MQKPKRYCLRGHDTWEVGRYRNKYCNQCHREWANRSVRNREISRAASRKYYHLGAGYMNQINRRADEGLREQGLGEAD